MTKTLCLGALGACQYVEAAHQGGVHADAAGTLLSGAIATGVHLVPHAVWDVLRPYLFGEEAGVARLAELDSTEVVGEALGRVIESVMRDYPEPIPVRKPSCWLPRKGRRGVALWSRSRGWCRIASDATSPTRPGGSPPPTACRRPAGCSSGRMGSWAGGRG